ncbi:MAG TPA: PEP-CTERM sorting domain-containing protein [Tepidisphaeraceae bacterium]|jgi:hypothetical protein|nr:PEP-CTERM sorting domain-containing protein [Tepidisphaeraceae bacterium]
MKQQFLRTTLVAAAVLGGVVAQQRAGAATTIDTGPIAAAPFDYFGYWGEGDVQTMGQTFIAPADSVLTDFSFDLRLDPAAPRPGRSYFRFYLMAWDGEKASGSVLYESGTLEVTHSGAPATYVASVGALALTPVNEYVAFLSSSAVLDGIEDYGAMAATAGNTYEGGRHVFAINGSDLAALTTTAWSDSPRDFKADAVFTAHFAAAPVPEPAALALAALSSLALLRRRQPGAVVVPTGEVPTA